MAKRKQITLIYQYNENWIGGTYYVLNIIRALNFLEDNLMPEILVAYDPNASVAELSCLNYPYLKLVPTVLKLTLLSRMANRFTSILFGKYFIRINFPGDNIYPIDFTVKTSDKKKFYFWIPDFQERYLPHFFSESEIIVRKRFQDLVAKLKKPVVFSSQNALKDFDFFYPGNTNKKVVLPFVSILNDDYANFDTKSLLESKSISLPFFIVSNQFWKHKNHFVVLKALKILIEMGIKIQVVLTGKEYDSRNPEYTSELRQYVEENKLAGHVLFLGFVSRAEQIALIKSSISIIQPSLFEGWSTVVEDAKALNHYIVLSDITLHREQINENCVFFDPLDPKDLSRVMKNLLNSKPLIIERDYNENIIKFASSFVEIF